MNYVQEFLNKEANGYCFYYARKSKYDVSRDLPFYTSPDLFRLSKSDVKTIDLLGRVIVKFMDAVNSLLSSNADVREVLQIGKPAFFKKKYESKYLFLSSRLNFNKKWPVSLRNRNFHFWIRAVCIFKFFL